MDIVNGYIWHIIISKYFKYSNSVYIYTLIYLHVYITYIHTSKIFLENRKVINKLK